MIPMSRMFLDQILECCQRNQFEILTMQPGIVLNFDLHPILAFERLNDVLALLLEEDGEGGVDPELDLFFLAFRADTAYPLLDLGRKCFK